MLSTEKISKAFLAIVDEAETALAKDPAKKIEKRLRTIISIAKHQSDIRGLKKGSCGADHGKCKK